jgi:ADP-ribosylglycohydrolase
MSKSRGTDPSGIGSLGQRFAVRDANLVVIHEVFSTAHLNAPFHSSLELRLSASGALVGEARFGCAIAGTDPICLDFSLEEADLFLRNVAEAKIERGPYSPLTTHTCDSPRIEVALHVRADARDTGGICLLFSSSQGEYHAPWGACLEGELFTLPGEDIGRAVEGLIGDLRNQAIAGFAELSPYSQGDEEHKPEVSPERTAALPECSRFVGCLVGGAIGDALGYPVEFEADAKAILNKYGAEPPEQLAYAGPARISDDTQMTIFTAEGIIRAFQRFNDRGICSVSGCLARAYARWYLTQLESPPPDQLVSDNGWLIREQALYSRRHLGNTCLSALAAGGLGSESQGTVAKPLNQSKGCGAVMRSAPIGLAAPDRGRGFEWARDGAVLTHGHPSGYLAAAYFASVIFDVARSMPLGDAMLRADELLVRENGHQEVAAIITNVRILAKAGPPSPAIIESLGEGWIAEEALGIALLCALTAEDGSPEACTRALWRSVVHKGDSDSTGSLTGNLLGAMFGNACLPPAWAATVELGDLIKRLARDLHAVSVEDKILSHADYPPI